ncbi:cytochrome c oxidase accessory protein CcoG [Azospirillum sp.]|uniref:cytochrome c oxidase accessory protein CcoG n=1 Tax=Azospirillum sp. TaxID=34012 RepID=UPI003D70A776
MQKLARSARADHRDAAPAPAAPAPAPLYAAHRKIYPKAVKGRFRRIKWALAAVLLALYAVLPWLSWDRGPGMPDQAVLLDLAAQRFYVFGVELWPQHIYYVTGAMILAAVGLFLATALAGRVWCGYACPQTVWTDLFVLAEEWIEGDRGARIRLDGGPRTAAWFLKKTAKHAVWMLIAAATGGTAILYFIDARGFLADLARLEASPLALGWMLFMAACTYAMAGFMREQMCRYVCPWPRFQAAMLDDESLVVTYQDWRGEGRGPVRKDRSWEARRLSGLGDCIDCGACVHVCPTGIDIRDGLQMDCISCGLCIDACDDVMTRIGRPGGLIRYDTQAAQTAKAASSAPAPYRLVRPRTIVYALLLVVVGGVMTAGLLLKPTVDVAVLRDRAPLYVTLADGSVQNSYLVKISNMSLRPQTYRIAVSGIDGIAVTAPGADALANGELQLSAGADSVQTYRIHARIPAGAVAARSTPLSVTLTGVADGATRRVDTVFLAP